MTESPTALICTDLAIGWQTGFDITSEMGPIAEAGDMTRSWNGRKVNLAMEEFRLLSVRISSGQGETRSPALAGMWPGTTFTMVPLNELPDVIPTGMQLRTLIRNPHPGSIRCVDLQFNAIPFTADGRVVTLAAPAATPIRIYFRPILTLVVTSPWRETFREAGAEVSWSLECEELGGDV